MTESDLKEAMARVEEKLEALIERIDRKSEIDEEWLHDHELRLRDLEKKQHNLMGKLVALMVMVMTGISILVAWLTSIWRG